MSLRAAEPQPYVAGLESLENSLYRTVIDESLKYQKTENPPLKY